MVRSRLKLYVICAFTLCIRGRPDMLPEHRSCFAHASSLGVHGAQHILCKLYFFMMSTPLP